MNEDSITLRFHTREAMQFPVGSSAGDFFITQEQVGKWNASTGVWDYELKFDAYYWLWANKILRYVIPGIDSARETTFTLTATIDLHANVILNCLNLLGIKHGGSPFRVETSDPELGKEAKMVRYENLSILGGIQAIAEAFDCEWWIEGNAIYFGRCENKGSEHVFEAGINTSTISFQQSKSEAPNRLYVYGSERNLPPNYRNTDGNDTIGGVVVRRLMLPEDIPYLQTHPDIPENQIVEKVVVLDSVYPRTDLTVTDDPETYTSQSKDEEGNTTTEVYYRLRYGDQFPFSESYVLPNEELHVIFQSGLLNGMEFGAKFNPKGLNEKNSDGSLNPEAQLIEIVVNEDYGRRLPDEVLRPQKGDKFILSGWDATKLEELGLLDNAEEELLNEGRKALEEYSKDLSTCTCPMAWDYMKPLFATNSEPKAGDAVTIVDTAHFGANGRKSRIIGFEYKLDKPYAECTYTCGENVSVKRLESIEKKIEGLAKSGTKVQLQNSLDFLSKRYSDRTPYVLSSDRGFEAGEFRAGVSGAMLGMDAQTGKSFAEVDYLYARVKAYFESLTVIEADTLAGKQLITPGGAMVCTGVKEVRNAQGALTGWRCFFLSEQDGEKTETKIIAGDQAFSEIFNAKAGTSNKVTNHRWWRLVTAVCQDAYMDESGNHYGYIEVSATDYESGSDIPQEGDVIAQLGNRNDATRQAAMIFSTVDSDAPSIKLFKGVGSGVTNAEHYSLSGHDIISYGYDTATGKAYFNCYGNHYVGARDKSTFIEFNEDSHEYHLHNVVLSVGSRVGNTLLGDIIQDIDNSKYLRDALNQYTAIKNGLVLTSAVLLGYEDNLGKRVTMAGHSGLYKTSKSIASFWGGPMVDRYLDEDGNLRTKPLTSGYAASVMRMDGSMYLGGGAHAFNADGSGWLGGEDKIKFGADGSMTFGNGIKINLNTGMTGLQETLESFANMLTYFVPEDAQGKVVGWNAGANVIDRIRVLKGFYSDSFISARGLNPGGSGSGGGVGLNLLENWDDYDTGKRGWALSAALGYELYQDKLSQATADSLYQPKGNYLTAITKKMVENVLTGNITSHSHSQYLTVITKQMVEEVLTGTITSHTHPYGVLQLKVNGGTQNTYNPSQTDGVVFEIKDMASASALASHVSNSTIHITDAERKKWDKTSSDLSAIIGTDTDNVINKWEEIVAFLDTYTEADTLANLLSNKADKSSLSNYLPLTGGSLMGELTATRYTVKGGADAKIILNNTDTENYWSYISFRQNNTEYGKLGTQGTHALSWNGNILWHAGNDGSGSGLDADMLDGNHLADILASNVASASKLQTARKLWGQDFDGTGDVSGNMTGVGSITSALTTTTHLNGNQGTAIINSTDTGTYTMLARMASANGYFTIGKWKKDFVLLYTAKATVDTGSNTYNHLIRLLDEDGVTSVNKLKIGSITLEDIDGALHIDKGVYSDSFMSARGANPSGGSSGGGATYPRLDKWSDYDTGKSGYVLSALLGYDLHTRMRAVEGKNLVTIGADGVSEVGRYLDFHTANYGMNTTQDYTARIDAGAANTSRKLLLPASSGTLATEEWVAGKNYLTSHQSLADYVTLNTAQTITGVKSFARDTFVLAASEKDEVKDRYLGNNNILSGGGYALRRGFDFRWYDWHWIIGNVRGWSTDSAGFGIGVVHEDKGNKVELGLRVTLDGIYANGFVKYDGDASQILMADGSVKKFYQSENVTSATADDGTLTPLAMNNWVSNHFLKLTGGILKNGSSVLPLILDTDSTEIGMRFSLGGASKGWAGYHPTYGANLYNYNCAKYLGLRDNGEVYVGDSMMWHQGNDGPGSGLDADLLDGVHNGSLTANRLNPVGSISDFNATLNSNGIYSWGASIPNSPNAYGAMLQWSNTNSPVSGTNQHWITQLASSTNNRLYYRTRTNNGDWHEWATIAFTWDNVASATKLQNTRYLWGRAFNGTEDIDGSMDVTGRIYLKANLFMWSPSAQWSDKGYYFTVGASELTLCTQKNGAWVSNLVHFTEDGKVGIGWKSPEYTLDVLGTIHASTGIFSDGYVSARGQNTSDARLKKDIRNFDAKDILMKLRPCAFRWNGLARSMYPVFDTDEIQYGLIAQEAITEAPWLVDKDMFGDGYMGVKYNRLIPVLLQGQIEQYTETEQLKNRVRVLEKRIEELKSR